MDGKKADNNDMPSAVNLLRREIKGLVAVYVYGTYGTEYERNDSDVDMAFLSDENVDVTKRIRLMTDLAGIFDRDVDLIDLKKVSTVMRANVIANARCIFDGDTEERERFEMYAYSSYALLNEERAGILKQIMERGSIHA